MANLIIPTKKNMNVTQSWVWTIAVAKGNFSLYEMRILARLVEIAQSEIDNKKPISQQLYELYLCPDISGNVDRYIVLPISSILDDNNGNNYARVKKAFVDLAGKVSDILCGEADAIGYLYRRGNKTIMSFKGGDNIIREARPLHLRNKEFVVIESDEEGNVTVNTKEIFPERN